MSSAAFVVQEKSPDAFRTISEVATNLDVPQHVLRFWESKFSQIKPVKRAGGRRYYRPEDIDLLRGIAKLLYSDGLTIRGVQKLLKDRGLRHVAMIGRGDAAGAVCRHGPTAGGDRESRVRGKTGGPGCSGGASERRRQSHLRAVPTPAPMSLPFFDEPVSAPAMALEEWISRLEGSCWTNCWA